MIQASTDPNELLFTESDVGMTFIFVNHSDDSTSCMSPEDILSALEEEYACPIIFLRLR